MQNPCIEADRDIKDDNEETIFNSENEIDNPIADICQGDLYVIGTLWIQALRAVLVGGDLPLVPVVKAADKPAESTPQKPPPMKYEDLPIYESPHYEYKDYMASKKACPKANVKILQTYLYPKVKSYRKSWVDSLEELKKDVGEMKADACACYNKKKKEIKTYLRAPENSGIRQAFVVAGAATGYYLGSGRGIPRRIFYTSLGALASGAVCFPKETDELFRNMSYNFAKMAIAFYNKTCGKNYSLREKMPCPDEVPPPPPARPPHQVNPCPKPPSVQAPP
ncbi:hypothetical protein B5X24_HaOG203777 [Helicoverpa armigera]|nr:uncharacterized protein LOC110384654 [Helicoverpa armigera]PZC84787.1 hypothetical protein B5X24_HaOG203777 [Helicoverpa armigera]